jgi:uncharacterized Zn-binding protein involved in type VI secretion
MSFDDAFAFVKVVASSLSGEAKALLLNLRGFADNDADDSTGEASTDSPAYGALGVISRPRPPSSAGAAEALAARTDDGLVAGPIRDLRISKARGNVREGGTSLAGYGGAFVAIDDAPSGGGSIITAYAPYAFDGSGVPAHAHSITMNTTPGQESIVIAAGDGQAVTMDIATGVTCIRSNTGKATIIMKDDAITISGKTIVLQGVVTVGNPATALPALPGPAFLGSTSLNLSP